MYRQLLGMAVSCLLAATPLAATHADEAEAAKAEYEQVITMTPNVENGRQLYLTCAVCHLPEGWGTPDGAYPQIAGQLPGVIIKQLADIRARNRDNPLMFPFSMPRILGGPQHVADVAAYVAQLPMTPRNGVGPGVDLELGQRVYADKCSDCHGDRGEGNAEKLIPAVAGQHYPYLVRQFDAIRTGRRKNANREMVEQIAAFTPREEAAVLDYASRLRPPPEKLAAEGWLNPDFPSFVREPMRLPAPPPPTTPAPGSRGAGG